MERIELIKICENAVVDESEWRNRDTASAQRQLGECWALLKAGCNYTVTDRRTDVIWLDVYFDGFMTKDAGASKDSESFYLPTFEDLKRVNGSDWY